MGGKGRRKLIGTSMVRKDFKKEVRLIIGKMQIKTTMRYHLTPVRMAIIKKSTRVDACQAQAEPLVPWVTRVVQLAWL